MKKNKIFNELASFMDNVQNISSKEFFIYMCADFSLLINGIFLILISIYPNETTPNTRSFLGIILVAMWFIFLPHLSPSTKDKVLLHIGYSCFSSVLMCIVALYWISNLKYTSFRIAELLIILISILCTTYFIYVIVNFIKLTHMLIRKVLKKILPKYEATKNGLLYTLESATSILVAISTFLTTGWAVITALKNYIDL